MNDGTRQGQVIIATGAPWLGEFATCRQGGVVFVDAERGRCYMAARLKDISRATGAKPDVAFLFRPPKLDAPWLASLVEERKPALLIVDSLSRLLPAGVKDTDNSAMSEVLGALRDIAERFGCCVLVLHHFRKRGELGDNRPVARVRGATAIVNTADVVLAIAKTKDGDMRVEVVKSYWGDAAQPFLCAWTPGENGGTSLTFAGYGDPESVTKVEQAMEIILGALESDLLSREEIAALCKAAGIGERSAFQALKELRGTDKVRGTKDGRRVLFGLAA